MLFAALLAAATVVPAAAQLRTSTTTPAPVLTADDLFDQSVVRDLRLTMKASDWDALVEHYLEDTYYRADMEWQGQVVPIVGVRSRGSGSRNPYKPGLKIAFAEYVDQRFLGLKSVVLANAIQDPSMLRQRASMAFFIRMGVPAPRVTHVRVFINDEYLGLYMLFEPVDKTFLARIFGPEHEQGKAQNTGFLYDYAGRTGTDSSTWVRTCRSTPSCSRPTRGRPRPRRSSGARSRASSRTSMKRPTRISSASWAPGSIWRSSCGSLRWRTSSPIGTASSATGA